MASNQAVKRIELLDGRFEIVPGSTVLLNPELEGRRSHVWGVWALDMESPCDLNGAASGKCLGPLMAYMSDREDLWKFGKHKRARFIDEADAEDCRSQTFELQKLTLDLIDKSGATDGRTFVIAWAMFDMMSKEKTVPMGTSFPLTKSSGGE